MPGQPLRRSSRLAAKAKQAHATMTTLNDEKAKRDAAKDERRTSKSRAKNTTIHKEATDAVKDDRESKKVTKTSRRGMHSRTSKICSLQSLEMAPRQSRRTIARKTGKSKRSKSPKKNTATSETPKSPTIMKSIDNQRVTPSPAVKPKHHAKVTPQHTVKSKGVKFNLGRNSIAEYNKENPPNMVEYLTDCELIPGTATAMDDEETRSNEELLAEWDYNFDEYLVDDDDDDI